MKNKRFLANALCLSVVALAAASIAVGEDKEPPEVTVDGLERVHDTQVALAYVRPEADFSVYKRVLIEEAEVAFRRGWERDQRRSVNRITSRDITVIKERTAELLREVFVEALEADGGWEVVDTPDYDVLLLRPSIVDLDISAPDVRRAGRSTTFVSSAGAATLDLELHDSVTGEILARALDRQRARDFGTFQHSSSVRNSAEARRIFGGWAGLLRSSLDEIHGRGAKTAEP